MTDEIGLRRDADRAARAKALLESDMLKESFAALKAGYVKAWADTRPGQSEEREKIYFAVKGLEYAWSHLEKVIGDGDMALAELRKSGLI